MEKYKIVQSTEGMGMWDKAIHAIIRPPKMTYDLERLGPEVFTNKVGTHIKRIDKQIIHGDELVEVSIYMPFSEQHPSYTPPNLILYCHCNASNRLECRNYVDYLPINYAIAGFDFLGCGNTKNMYISLGWRQSQQIRTIVSALQPMFRRIVPWGRSMGAASVLLYGQAPISVVDSVFVSIDEVGRDAALTQIKMPKCILCCLFPCIWCCARSSVRSKAEYDMNKVNTMKAVKRMSPYQAIIFIVSEDDDLVFPSHSKKLFQKFQGRKVLITAEGTHTTKRKKQVFDQVIVHLERMIAQNDAMPMPMMTIPTELQLVHPGNISYPTYNFR